MPLVAVAHVDVRSRVARLSATLAASKVRKIHGVFSGLTKYAVHDRRVPRNPCDLVRLPRVASGSRGYPTPEQVDELAASCGPDADLVSLLAYTGLRWGELADLKVKRVGLMRHRLDVAEAVTEPEGRVIWARRRTTSAARYHSQHFSCPCLRADYRAERSMIFSSVRRTARCFAMQFPLPTFRRASHLVPPHRTIAGHFCRRYRFGGAADARPRVCVDDARRV